MNLYAISDLHVAYAQSMQLLEEMPEYPHDWLIIAGDIGEKESHYHTVLSLLNKRFAQLIWVPGNHDLWTLPTEKEDVRGVAKYQRLVELCRSYGVITPEDPYVLWPGAGKPYRIVPLFTLYDYSFRPSDVSFDMAVDWAAETNVIASDEVVLHPDPYRSRAEWCAVRCAYSEARLAQLQGEPTILINHFPLREDLIRLKKIPRFSLWCGTKRTEDWHRRFNADIVVSGHLHMRATDYRHGTRFEEVSLGYPRHYKAEKGIAGYLRLILPRE